MDPRTEREVEGLLPTLTVPVDENDRHLNPLTARYTLVEYVDFESPNCRQGYHVVRELLQDLDEDLCYVVRHFPQRDVHPHAELAAQAAEAADMQAKFWLMHDRLFEHQAELGPALVRKLAREMALDLHHFERDLDSEEARRRIGADRAGGVGAGVVETPTFFANGRMHVGSYEFDPLYEALTGRAERKG